MLNAIFFIAKWAGAWSWVVKRQNSRQRRETFFKTLFFPDNKVACKAEFTQRHGCTNKVCHFSHDPKSSYAQLMKLLQSACRTLDVCVFTITCHDLADIVIDLHNKGVVVRLITDDEQVDASGSQIGAFRAAGIQVRQDKTPFFMHHKFMLLDGHTLMTGSFNWTRQAIMGNNENLLITNHADLVNAFGEEFEKLWKLFNPRNI